MCCFRMSRSTTKSRMAGCGLSPSRKLTMFSQRGTTKIEKSKSLLGDSKMRYRLTILCLVTTLIAPYLLESAPAPRQTYPEVYALVYVGKGKNDRANVQRINDALSEIQDFARTVCHDPEVLKLPIFKEKNMDELSRWAKKQIRVGTLEGTSVLRVWLADGTPEEQAVVINATLRAYFKLVEKYEQNDRRSLEKFRRNATQEGVLEDEKIKKEIQEREEKVKSYPRLLEWAAV